MQITGDCRVGEAAKVAPRVQRLIGVPRWPLLLWLAMILVFVALGGMAGAQAGWWLHVPSLISLLGGIFLGSWLSWALGLPLYRRLHIRVFRKHFLDRGGVDPLPLTVELTPDHLTHTLGAVRRTIPWSAVTHLLGPPGFWVFVAQGEAIYLPRRLFADPAAERAFVAEALSFMGEAAKARSPQAAAFILA